MQDPIIDLITSAYINNGWTGLDSDVNNLIDVNKFNLGCWIQQDGTFAPNATYGAITDYIKIVVSGTYSITIGDVYSYAIVVYDSNKNFVIRYYNTQNVQLTAGSYIRFQLASSGVIGDYITQEYIETANPGIKNDTGRTINETLLINDFRHHLKLPLPHYFPHPVIDALQRAAAGTQTADDTEVLRHYLTPLGIGGI